MRDFGAIYQNFREQRVSFVDALEASPQGILDYGLLQHFDGYEAANSKATGNAELMNLVVNPDGINDERAKADVQGIIKEMEFFELVSGAFKRREVMPSADQLAFYAQVQNKNLQLFGYKPNLDAKIQSLTP